MPTSAWIVIGVLLLLPPGLWLYRRVLEGRLKQKLEGLWGKEAALRRPDDDVLLDIADYYRAGQRLQPDVHDVDDITWNDLDMDALFRQVDAAQSYLGSEGLYALLRSQTASGERIAERARLSDALLQHPEQRLQLQVALHGIGYSPYHGASRYLNEPEQQLPERPWLYYLLGTLPALSLLIGLVLPPFLIVAIGFLLINFLAFYRLQSVWEKEMVALKHLARLVVATKRICRIDWEELQGFKAEAKELLSKLRPVRFWLPLFGMQRQSDLDFVTEYLRIIFMLDMVSLCRIGHALKRLSPQLSQLYRRVAELDALLSLAQLKLRKLGHCAPAFHEALAVEAVDLCHPLIEEPVPNSLSWRKPVLISGSNASGKSTFIKAMAINSILAQSLGLCFAASFCLCRCRVMSSMALRDNLLAGESYFIAEIRSLKRILDAVDQGLPVLCFIDEILRGTNTLERIAASSAVMRSLAGQDALCMAATHDIELTRMLADAFDNHHFSETVDERGVSFDYRIKPGPTRTRNAILLLSTMGFDPQIIGQARAALQHFEETGVWPGGGSDGQA